MQKILLLICLLFVMACTSDEIKEDKDYYSPVKSQLKEYIIQTKAESISICLPDSFSSYQGIMDLHYGIDELRYKLNRNDCSIHIKIWDKKKKGIEDIETSIKKIKVEYPEAMIYTKQLTNDKDTIYYLNFMGRQQDDDRNIAYVNFSCGIIRNDMVYSVGLDAVKVGHIIDLELYDEIMNSVRIVD